MSEALESISISPLAYAARLATYISDPSTIRVRTLDAFSRAPTVEQCHNLRQAHLAKLQREAPKSCDRFRYWRCAHPQTEENTILTYEGWDKCRTCLEAEQAAREAKKHAAATAEEKARAHRLEVARIKRARRLRELEEARLSGMTRPRITTDAIAAVADLFGITVADLKSSARHKHLVSARMVAVKVLREGGQSYPQIKRLLNRKCHTSIIYLEENFKDRAGRDPFLLEAYNAVRRG